MSTVEENNTLYTASAGGTVGFQTSVLCPNLGFAFQKCKARVMCVSQWKCKEVFTSYTSSKPTIS